MTDDVVYICERCGEGFTLEDGKTLHTDEGDITLCPNCLSSDIEEAKLCPICHEIRYEWKFTGGVCEDCFNDAVSAYKAYLNYLQPWEREALDDHYGNIDVTEED